MPGLIRERVTNDAEVEKYFTQAKSIRATATTVSAVASVPAICSLFHFNLLFCV